jgi:hypothetical protein
MKQLFATTSVPWLQSLFGSSGVFTTCDLETFSRCP